jgi:polyhydroxybutyrate depolymerase
MNNISLVLAILFAFNVNAQQNIDKTITHNGLSREYRLYIPASYNANTSVPLLFNLHGYSSNNLQQEFYGNFKPIADTANFIICHPNGTLDLSNNRYWSVGFAPDNIDDVDFISTLIDEIAASYNIDASRVYSTGMSNGGFMSYSLACQLSDRVAAIASVTGTMTLLQQGNCSPSRTVPVMQIHGTNDPTVPYTGNTNFLHIDTLVKNWVNRNGCTGSPSITNVPDIVTGDGATATRFDYDNCNTGGKVALYKITNGAHTWPGASINIGVTCMDFSASLEIWKFFLQFRHPNPNPIVTVSEKQSNNIQFYPNPANNTIMVKGNTTNTIKNIQLFDLAGKLQYAQLNNAENTIDITALPNGVYMLNVLLFNGEIITEKIIKQ